MTNALVLGLGGCVDFEVVWKPDELEALAREFGITESELDLKAPVTDERSLLCSILAFVRDGVGGERPLPSSDVAIRFASRFPHKVTLGGTCVRAALAIIKLGIPSLVHLVSIDDNVRRLLTPGIEYISSATHDTLDPHLIIQFPAGAAIRLDDARLTSPHPNRVIYVNDPPNRDLPLSHELPTVLGDARAFLVAGFNVMVDPDLLRDRLASLQESMRRLPEDAVVFYEDAGFHDDTMRAIVSEHFRGRVDVHSLNEDELQTYIGRRIDLLDLDEVVAALEEFRRFAIAPVTVVHTKYWSLAHGSGAGRYRQCLAGGIDLASARYRHGDDFTPSDVERIGDLPTHPGGTAFAAALGERLGEWVSCVPGRLIDCEVPTTIGLGDTFVGGFLAALVTG